MEKQKYSLGRFNLLLPNQFVEAGRQQSIYEVSVDTKLLNNNTADEIWSERINIIKAENSLPINPNGKVWERLTNPNISVLLYQTDIESSIVKVEAQKNYNDHILILKCEGKKDMEKDILSLLSIVVEGYRMNIKQGFYIGLGSIVSPPSIREFAAAKYEKSIENIELTIKTQTVGIVKSNHPLENIKSETETLAAENIILTVLKNKKRTVADMVGFEGLITIVSPEEDLYRYTWFYQGETGNSFKPEILIKLMGPTKNLENANETWEQLLESIHSRQK